jgi:hypothetical protein
MRWKTASESDVAIGREGARARVRISSSVLAGGAEHQHRTGIPPSLGVQHHARIGGPGVLVHEGVRPQQPHLLGVGDEHDHVVGERRPGP